MVSFRCSLFAGAALLALGASVGCGSTGSPKGTSSTEPAMARSNLERDLSPDVPAGDQTALAQGNAAFAFDLYSALAERDGNLFFSPYSISAALAMTYAGARGETESEMATTLHFTLPQEQLHPAFNQLDLTLESRSEAEPPPSLPDGQPPQLNIANSLWGQEDYSFEAPFLDTLALNYGAGLRLVDFAGDSEGARVTINDWVSRETEARIPELLAPGTITTDTRLVLTNAIYFLANWLSPFEPEATQPGTFYVDGATEATVDMMHQTENFDYAAGDGYQAVALPYVGSDLSMLLLVPDAGRFAEVEANVDAELMGTVVGSLESRNVQLAMPKWKFDASFMLGQTLQALGMPSAFSPSAADFSGMTTAEQLWISEVIHQAYISVDEAGTEAAAATAVVMVGMAMPTEPVDIVTLDIDRPFLFVIRDAPTGAVLFAGRVTDPR